MSKKKEFQKIKKGVEELKQSSLYEFRIKNNYKPVIGEGTLDADIMFVGEAPGKNEAETGRPFVGSAGKILDDLIETAGLKRGEVYITSVLFDRPPKNRNPRAEEIDTYFPYLKRIIEVIDPKIIVTLGNFAIKTLKNKFAFKDEFNSLRMDHGKPVTAKVGEKKVQIFPTYHPAAMLYNRSLERTLREDFIELKKLV